MRHTAIKHGTLGGFFDWIDRLPRRQDLRALARCLAEHVNRHGEAWPSHKRLADMAVMSRDTVRELLNELIALGFLADTGRRVGRAWAKVRVLRVVGFVPADWQTWGDDGEPLQLPPVDNPTVQTPADATPPCGQPAPACPQAAPGLPCMEGRNKGTLSIPAEAHQPEQPTAEQPRPTIPAPPRVREFIARKRAELGMRARGAAVSVMDALSGMLPGHAVPS